MVIQYGLLHRMSYNQEGQAVGNQEEGDEY